MRAADTLTAVRDLLSDPARWTKGAYARNGLNVSTVPCNAIACAWCPRGAMEMVCGEDPRAWRPAEKILTGVVARGYGGIEAWNDADETTHGDVLAAFDEAIAIARGGRS